MTSIARISDPIDDEDICGDNPSTTVLAENLVVVRQPDLTEIDQVPYSTFSPNVFANNQPVERVGDITIDNGTIISGALTVGVNTPTGAGAVFDNLLPVKNGVLINAPSSIQSTYDPSYTAANPDITANEGSLYEKDDQDSIAPLPPGTGILSKTQGQTDLTPSSATTPISSCPDVNSLPDNFNWINADPSYADGSFTSFQTWSSSFQLSTNYSVYNLSMHTSVSRYKFTNTVNQNGSSSLTQKQTLGNLCYHANTVLEPLFAKYGSDMVVTSGFRSLSGASQHNKGQATDLQFLSLHNQSNTAQLYFNRAQEIKGLFNFDQLILEWFGKNPWLHISSNQSGNRGSVLTQTSPNGYSPGLILLH